MTGQEYVQKTSKRIERDKKLFDEFMTGVTKATPEQRKFFKEYRLGFMRKSVAIIQHDGERWVGSGNDPRNKVYGQTAEAVVKQLLGVRW